MKPIKNKYRIWYDDDYDKWRCDYWSEGWLFGGSWKTLQTVFGNSKEECESRLDTFVKNVNSQWEHAQENTGKEYIIEK